MTTMPMDGLMNSLRLQLVLAPEDDKGKIEGLIDRLSAHEIAACICGGRAGTYEGQVVCYRCGRRGPAREHLAGAIIEWNEDQRRLCGGRITK